MNPKMVRITEQHPIDEELLLWIDMIPLSKPMKSMKNSTRDFSDAVFIAEILKYYYPQYIELYDYIPGNNINIKRNNWNMLNRKVLTKLDIKLSKDMIHHLIHASQSSIEKLLSELRSKILKDGKEIYKSQIMQNNNIENNDIQEKIEEQLSRDNINLLSTTTIKSNAVNEIRQFNPSKFEHFKRGFLFLFSWINYLFPIWNIFDYCKLPRFGKHKTVIDVTTERIENINEEIIPRAIYIELKQELQDKQEIICTLNHKIVFLEKTMKLKDTHISNLTSQVLRNAQLK